MARKRPYQLLCPIARALDVVGDRWTLLILRDLHAGPARFQAIQEGLGVATNLLTLRLGELVDAGVIEKLERDGHSAYALTDLGLRTDRLLWELSRFGSRLDPDRDPRPPGNLRTVALPLRIMLGEVSDRPIMTVRLLIDDETFHIVSTVDSVEVLYGGPGLADGSRPAADVVIRTGYIEFLAVGEGRMDPEQFVAEHLEVVEGPEHLEPFMDWMGRAVARQVSDAQVLEAELADRSP